MKICNTIQVYQLEGRTAVLLVPAGKSNWAIQDSVEDSGSHVQSAAVTSSPAHKKSASSETFGYTSWHYWDSGWKGADIMVTCTWLCPWIM